MAENQTISVQLYGNTAEPLSGQMQIERWSNHEANTRARKKVLKAVGTILACSPICLFVHVMVIPVVLCLFGSFIGAFPAYMYLSEEKVTCVEVEAVCPYCQKQQKLRPYPTGRYKDPMTVQCRACGQTSKAYPAETITSPA